MIRKRDSDKILPSYVPNVPLVKLLRPGLDAVIGKMHTYPLCKEWKDADMDKSINIEIKTFIK